MYSSLPSRECGLKYQLTGHIKQLTVVTPFAGVWIEIKLQKNLSLE